MNNIRLILTSEKDLQQGGLFQEYFHSFPNCSVSKHPFEENEGGVDVLVIPIPSSFGHFKGHEISEFYMSKVDDKTKERINKHILSNCFGEQNPATPIIIRSRSKLAKYRYVAFLSLCRFADGPIPNDFAYTAMRGLLLGILEFNKNKQNSTEDEIGDGGGDAIESVVLPTLAFGAQLNNIESKKQITKHMALAYRNMFYPIRHMPSADEALILNSQIHEKVTHTPQERRNRAKEMLKSGELERRGLYDEEELQALIDLISTENELREQAAKALASFIQTSPSEFTLSTETICSMVAKAKDGLSYLLDEAERGHLNIYRSIEPKDITYGDVIGMGSEASVYRATWNGLAVAVKKFKGVPNTKEFQRELSIMSLIQHPNLLRCYGGYTDSVKDIYYLVLELMETDVNNVLHENDEGSEVEEKWQPSFDNLLKVAVHTARGMEYLHSCNLMHRDLKSVNLLIDRDFNTKVCDFGLSRVIAPKKSAMTGNVGTVSWIAPEVFENQPYDQKADIYSFGIVLWELYTKQTPFESVNAFEIPMVVIKGDRPTIPKDCPKEYAKLIKQCWSQKPAKRPPFALIIKELQKIHKKYSKTGSSLSSSLPILPTLSSASGKDGNSGGFASSSPNLFAKFGGGTIRSKSFENSNGKAIDASPSSDDSSNSKDDEPNEKPIEEPKQNGAITTLKQRGRTQSHGPITSPKLDRKGIAPTQITVSEKKKEFRKSGGGTDTSSTPVKRKKADSLATVNEKDVSPPPNLNRSDDKKNDKSPPTPTK